MWTAGPMTAYLRSGTKHGPVPPPTPVVFPSRILLPTEIPVSGPLCSLLQGLHRPSDIKPAHFSALGLVLVNDEATAEDLVPDPKYLPDFASWETLTPDEAREKDESTRSPLSPANNNKRSPGCQVYLDRKRELSYRNADAFRTVRRLPHPKGATPPRLGGSYDFWKSLEALSVFWDDPTDQPPPSPSHSPSARQAGGGKSAEGKAGDGEVAEGKPGAGEAGKAGEGKAADAEAADGKAAQGKVAEVKVAEAKAGKDASAKGSDPVATIKPEDDPLRRLNNGSEVPVTALENLAAAFIKLVAYEYGCSVAPARVEPRLTICSPPSALQPSALSSTISSNCGFVTRSPSTRATARACIVHGPVAAVSARTTVEFKTELDSVLDLTREVTTALLTAQYRARQGRAEKRFGEGEWWATKARWGGGPGGPIGREVDKSDITGDKDAPRSGPGGGSEAGSGSEARGGSDAGGGSGARGGSAAAAARPIRTNGPPKVGSRSRKAMTVFDHYRIIRGPSPAWDPKMMYEAIGRTEGAGYDDLFVFSILYHHISIVRFRVSDRLLEALDGSNAADPASWGSLPMWRSRWFDFYLQDDRLEALRITWGILSYMLRRQEAEAEQTAEAGNGEPAGGQKTHAGAAHPETADTEMADA